MNYTKAPSPNKSILKSAKYGISLLVSLSLIFSSVAYSQSASETNESRVTKKGFKSRSVMKKPARTSLKAWHDKERITVKFSENTDIRLRKGKLKSTTGIDLSELNNVLEKHNVNERQLRRYFNQPEAKIDQLKQRGEARSHRQLANLNLYYSLRIGADVNLEQLCDDLNALDIIEMAEPEAVPSPNPIVDVSDTPDFSSYQTYKDSAPTGIGANVTIVPGARGKGIKVLDVEYDWVLDHEDLQLPASTNVDTGTIDNPFPENEGNHGTAVLGMLVGLDNSYGMTGIVPEATALVSPSKTFENGYSVARAITVATAALNPGDVMLLEAQTRVCNTGEYGPTEWNQTTFDAISAATANGIIVVEAAGNGNVDLDQADCLGLFDRSVRDSGAIIVGAAHSSTGARLSFSSYGSRVDVQGWGHWVDTTGYGTLYDTGDILQRYSNSFSGTSSASPIVTGAAVAVQGALLAANAPLLTSIEMRELLTDTGTDNWGTEEIGPLPNIVEALLTFDRDGDNLLDSLEEQLGTDPDNSDTDGDGISDFDELNRDGDATTYTPGVDTNPLEGVVSAEPQLVWPNDNAAIASSAQDGHPAANVGDGSLDTRWSAQNAGETITFDLGEVYSLSQIKIAFLKGDARETYFDLEISTDGNNFTTVSTGLASSGASNSLESFDLSGSAQYVRIVGQGNSSNNWNSLTEVEVWDAGSDVIEEELASSTLNTFGSASSSQTIDVTSNVSWAFSSNETWIAIGNYYGSENGSSQVQVGENTSSAARVGTITLTGGSITQTIVIEQDGAEYIPYELAVSTSSLSFESAGSSSSVNITSNIDWTVSDNASWLSAGITSGSDNGSVTFTAAENTSTDSRSATITVIGGYNAVTIAVTQDGAEVIDDVLTVSVSNLTFAAAGEELDVDINANVSWSISDDASWLNADVTSGADNDTVIFTADKNTDTSSRSATISVSSNSITRSIEVTQAGGIISGGDPVQIDIAYEYASSDDGNVIANTLDGDVGTRWSANGDGEYATYDLGAIKAVSSVNIAFFKGSSRNTYFSIAVSENGSDFTTFISNETSSGDTTSLEEFVLSTQTRYVRIIGHGNSSNTWNSLTEVEIWGTTP